MYKILLVDDEKEIRYGLKNYFPWGQLGFEVVHHCENGELALDYLKKHDVNVVLTDIRMPVVDGLQLAKQLDTKYAHIHTIILSGYKDFQYAKEAIKYGVKDYIIKPGKYEEMHEVFSQLKKELDTSSFSNKGDNSYTDNIIQTIKNYAEENYADISLDDLAELCKMSPNYISTFFKEKTGTNFSTYITDLRMRKAMEMLDDFHYKTYEISSLVGYNNPKNFTRMFKKYYGMTPRDYRKQEITHKEP
ncbi:response regulator transcription factor [Gracilibacillus alcaliphilus]|uniref:response regulator transcription factor n=1 Tax=Gracilibacillus alcaliphilus TaxID=1401441 RepID=UPI00195A216C|nr:response regulator [Gracilibacillus alcaliphilus]MBM7677152.1 YesN/AraC family two-component response regulator [Gracilibacillus alcaliphilus]